MNTWTEKSIKLANSPGYLDKLHAIYKIQENEERVLPPKDASAIKKLHKKKDVDGLINKLIELDKFPIDDPYMGCLKFSDDIIKNNPKTVNRIGARLMKLNSDSLLTLCKQPKSGTRQLGHMFKQWLPTLKYPILDEEEFDEHEGPCILRGGDTTLENYVNSHLGGNLTKGIDLVLKIKENKYLIGEAKFITTHGGTQTNQLNVALDLTEKNITNATTIAIVDGIVWFNTSYKKKIIDKNNPIMSALLFRHYLDSFTV